jgi:hypothetical protein
MGGWAMPSREPFPPLPAGLAVAGMGRRSVAWVLDGIFAFAVGSIPWIVAVAQGALGLNQRALDQVDLESVRPFGGVTVPFINAGMGTLVAAALASFAILAAYYVVSWVAAGGTPAQKMLGLAVADAETAGNLSFAAASIRWLALYGLAGAVSMVLLLAYLQVFSTIAGRDWMGSGYGLPSGSYVGLTLMSDLASLASTGWTIVLLVSTARRPDHRGLHDRWAGSIVIGKAQPAWPNQGWPAQPGWAPPVPGGWPPAAPPNWPGMPGPAQPNWGQPAPGQWPEQPPLPGAWPPPPWSGPIGQFQYGPYPTQTPAEPQSPPPSAPPVPPAALPPQERPASERPDRQP